MKGLALGPVRWKRGGGIEGIGEGEGEGSGATLEGRERGREAKIRVYAGARRSARGPRL